MSLKVRKERTGWRDEELSRRHRLWGWDCPAIDIDFLMLEYNRGEPVAVVEYKHENAPLQKPKHPSYKAIRSLCDKAEIPFFGVRYAHDFTWWRITSLNSLAKKSIPVQRREELWTERDWVEFLYGLRESSLPLLVYGDDGRVQASSFSDKKQISPSGVNHEIKEARGQEGKKAKGLFSRLAVLPFSLLSVFPRLFRCQNEKRKDKKK